MRWRKTWSRYVLSGRPVGPSLVRLQLVLKVIPMTFSRMHTFNGSGLLESSRITIAIQYRLGRKKIGYCFGAAGQNAIDKFNFQNKYTISELALDPKVCISKRSIPYQKFHKNWHWIRKPAFPKEFALDVKSAYP